jgi:hypothetical protein
MGTPLPYAEVLRHEVEHAPVRTSEEGGGPVERRENRTGVGGGHNESREIRSHSQYKGHTW